MRAPEGAPAAGRADEMNLSPEKPGDLAADGQAQPGAAVLPARAAVRLLEGFEDDLLLVGGDADARVGHREGEHRIGAAHALSLGHGDVGGTDGERDTAVAGELERVG